MLEVGKTLLYLSESEEESVPKKPVTPINGGVATKPHAKYVNNINQTKKCKNMGKIEFICLSKEWCLLHWF